MTKIIATLGPATGSREKIRRLVRAGVNLFRLNMSHGDHDTIRQWIQWVRDVERERDTFLGLILDLQGPKLRVGRFENGAIALRKGQRVEFIRGKKPGKDGRVPVANSIFFREVQMGERVYLDDGKLCARVTGISDNHVQAEVLIGGRLSDHKGINLPDSILNSSPLTRKDLADLKFGLEEGVDWVALSFVGSAEDVRTLRRKIHDFGGNAEVIVKIERKQALEDIEGIVQESDAVMVARGDLGIELPLSEVPIIQRRIVQECLRRMRPVIVATQMLESMIENSRPTRAEVSDVSHAVLSETDAVMLSGETAVGKFPEAAVRIMVDTALEAEAYQRQVGGILPWRKFTAEDSMSFGLSYAACELVERLGAKAHLAFTLSGRTARRVAAPRPHVPLFVFTSDRSRARKLTLLRGALPFLIATGEEYLQNLPEVFRLLKGKKLLRKNDRVVITSASSTGVPGETNLIRVETVS